MDNFERAERARKALKSGSYEDVDNTINTTLPTPDGEEVQGNDVYPISDLIADLLSLATSLQRSPVMVMTEAWEHHGADIVEQAWEHNDGWDSLLQTPANRERAIELLRQNEIPEEHWPGVLSKTGLDNCPDEKD